MDDNSTVEIEVPHDRNSTFKPLIIPKHDRRAPCSMIRLSRCTHSGCATATYNGTCRMSMGVEVSPELIYRVTESVIEDVRQWRNRPLEKSYLILFLDALRVNSMQDGKNVNKALYVAPAINWEGKKEVLGLWLADTEGAKFRMSMLTNIKNRGTKDILIACTDGLSGNSHSALHSSYNPKLDEVFSYEDLKQVYRDLKEFFSVHA